MQLRDLPSVDELARGVDDPLAVDAARRVIERAREEIRAGSDPGDLGERLRAGVEVVLEVRVAGGRGAHALDGSLGQRGAAQVRVHDHAGRVQHAAMPRPPGLLELGAQAFAQVAGIRPGPDLLPRAAWTTRWPSTRPGA